MTGIEEVQVAMLPLGKRDGALVIEPYRAGAIYSIDDVNPCLWIGFVSGAPAKLKGSTGSLPRDGTHPSTERNWWRWQPIANNEDHKIGQLRRYGHYRGELHSPCAITLECYVWPGLFFDAVAYQRMLVEIADVLGDPVEWEPEPGPVRAQVVSTHGRPTDAERRLPLAMPHCPIRSTLSPHIAAMGQPSPTSSFVIVNRSHGAQAIA